MTGIREVAEPLHQAVWPLEGRAAYNAGLDALVDAVEQSGMVLIPAELAKRLAGDLKELDHYLSLLHADSTYRTANWRAARELIDIAEEIP